MEIFADTANLREIEEALKRGFIRGVTTNPSILANEPKDNYLDHIARIVELLNKYQSFYKAGIHLSVEVFSRDVEEIIRQAKEFSERLKYRHLSVKVQIGWDELGAIKILSGEGFSINCTCCMSITQAVMAAAAGARYVSLFSGRIRDGGIRDEYHEIRDELREKGILDDKDYYPAQVIYAVRSILDESYPQAEIIVGSVRKVTDIRDAALAGAHIVTIPPKYFRDMVTHFKTEEVVKQFLTDFKNWTS